MYSLAKRHWRAQLSAITALDTEVPDPTHDWEFLDIVHTPTTALAEQQPAEAWPPKETLPRPLLRRLQRRATVTPGTEPSDKLQDQTEEIENIRMRKISSSKKDTPSRRAASPEDNESHTLAFQVYIEEAAATLDKVSRERSRPPWWERVLLYLRAVWRDEPPPSYTSSRLLYWHVHALEHERISVKPIANGEYVVAFDSAIILQRPRKDMPSFYKLLRSFTHATDWSHERLDSPSESRKVYMTVD